MQSSSYVSFIVSGSADQHVQERIKEAEKQALIKIARSGQPSSVSSIRFAFGQFMVGFGRRVAGRPHRREKSIESPGAIRMAR